MGELKNWFYNEGGNFHSLQNKMGLSIKGVKILSINLLGGSKFVKLSALMLLLFIERKGTFPSLENQWLWQYLYRTDNRHQ